MAIKFTLQQVNIKNNKSHGKWYAHTVKQGELSLNEIEKLIQARCSLTAADVKAAVVALKEVVEEGLKNGMVVNLDELGKFYLSIRSECVDNPDDFRVSEHVTDIVCKYTPAGHRSNPLTHDVIRPFTNDVKLEELNFFNPETKEYEKRRRSGMFRKG